MDDLIREWIHEDRFLKQYTKRQRSILCKKLTEKLSKYKEQEEALQKTDKKLMRYRQAYASLLRERNPLNWVCWIVWIIWTGMFLASILRKLRAISLWTNPPESWPPTGSCQTESYKTIDPVL